MENHTTLHKAAALLAQHYSVDFRCVESVPDDDQAPFCAHVGITEDKAVVYTKSVYIGYIVHELAHVLFGMDICEEEFLAWEWQVALWLTRQGLGTEQEWDESMANYQIDHHDQDTRKIYHTFRCMPPDIRQKYLDNLLVRLKDHIRARLPGA